MTFTTNILIGNIISLVAGIMVVLSIWVNDSKRAYKFQIYSALVLMVSSLFFESFVGFFIFLIIAIRLMFVYKDRLSLRWTIFFLVVPVSVALAVNTLGFIGLIPVIATIQITICNYAYKDIRWIKLSFIVNEAFYIIYFLLVYDFVSTAVQIITVVIGCISYINLVKSRKAEIGAVEGHVDFQVKKYSRRYYGNEY